MDDRDLFMDEKYILRQPDIVFPLVETKKQRQNVFTFLNKKGIFPLGAKSTEIID